MEELRDRWGLDSTAKGEPRGDNPVLNPSLAPKVRGKTPLSKTRTVSLPSTALQLFLSVSSSFLPLWLSRPSPATLGLQKGCSGSGRGWELTAAVLTGRGPLQAHVMLGAGQGPEGLHAFARRRFAVKGLIVQRLHNVLQRPSCAHVKVTVFTRRALEGKLLAQKLHNPGSCRGTPGARRLERAGGGSGWAGRGRAERREGEASSAAPGAALLPAL